MKNFYIIGCGGVCTYFLPAFFKTINHDKRFSGATTTLIDGDTVEQKNLLRQNFYHQDSGSNSIIDAYKSEVLAEHYSSQYPNLIIESQENYITDSLFVEEKSFIFCFVDNHPARKDVLSVVDIFSCEAIFAANSSISSHAYYYNSKMKGGSMDPRNRFPEILTIDTGSPVRAAGCDTEVKLNDVPQTAIANQMAATHALFIWNFWATESKKMSKEESYEIWPIEFMNNSCRYTTIAVENLK
jgi:hypothetical protein